MSISLILCSLPLICSFLLFSFISSSSIFSFKSISFFFTSNIPSFIILSCSFLSLNYSTVSPLHFLILASLSAFSIAQVSPILSMALFPIVCTVSFPFCRKSLFLFSPVLSYACWPCSISVISSRACFNSSGSSGQMPLALFSSAFFCLKSLCNLQKRS